MGKNTTHARHHASADDNTKTEATSSLFEAVETHGGRELVDQLRELGLDHYVELPQIAVMGDTSSGKSSLLSALSGVTFPSSGELTTRCPTQLILSKRPEFHGRVRLHRYASNVIEHEGNIDSMQDVPLAIERLTKLLVEEGQQISDDAIVIELSGPELPNLTLTDLPGLVRTVEDGEDKSIIGRIRAMVQRYMEQSRTIVIAIVPANVDIHNTEILQAAKEADPEGVRTIAVVTKLDLVDPGTENAVREMLMNEKEKLVLGSHAVKCRGQKDLDDGVTIEQGKRREQDFFRSHDYWKSLPPSYWGIDKLTSRLVQILQSNIRRTLPNVMKEIHDQIAETETELDSLGSSFDSSAERRRVFCDWVDRFVRPLQAVLKGDYEELSTASMVDKNGVDMHLRAQVRAFDEKFRDLIKATYDKMPGQLSEGDDEKIRPGDYVVVYQGDAATDSYCVQAVNDHGDVLCPAFSPDEWLAPSRYEPKRLNHLRRLVAQNRGDELSIFPSHSAFHSILRQWVDTWKPPTMELAREYEVVTLRVAKRLAKELHATPSVEEYVLGRAEDVVEELRNEAEMALTTQLAVEGRPNNQDPELSALLIDMLRPRLEQFLTERVHVVGDGLVPFTDLAALLPEMAQANGEHAMIIMDCWLRAHFVSAMTRFVNLVPMRLRDLLLYGFVDRVKKTLEDTSEDQLEQLLSESDSSRVHRMTLLQKLDTLRKTDKLMKDIGREMAIRHE